MKALGLIPSTTKKRKRKKEEEEGTVCVLRRKLRLRRGCGSVATPGVPTLPCLMGALRPLVVAGASGDKTDI